MRKAVDALFGVATLRGPKALQLPTQKKAATANDFIVKDVILYCDDDLW